MNPDVEGNSDARSAGVSGGSGPGDDHVSQLRREQSRVGIRMSAGTRQKLKIAMANQDSSAQEFFEACAIAYLVSTPTQQQQIARAVRNPDASVDGAQLAGAQLYDLITANTLTDWGGTVHNTDPGVSP